MAKLKSTDPYGSTYFERDDAAPALPSRVREPVTGEALPAPAEAVSRHRGVGATRVTAEIGADLHRRLEMRVVAEETTVSDFVRGLLEAALADSKPPQRADNLPLTAEPQSLTVEEYLL